MSYNFSIALLSDLLQNNSSKFLYILQNYLYNQSSPASNNTKINLCSCICLGFILSKKGRTTSKDDSLHDLTKCLFKFPAGQELIRFLIFLDRLVDDVLRQQIVAVRIGLEPVTHKLLVIGALRLAGLVALQRPET